jgi:penicillin-binding protein 1A
LRDLFNDDPRPEGWKPKLSRFFLDLDSRIDSGLYHARRWGRELYERYTVFMDRFHVSGWRRWYLIEPI